MTKIFRNILRTVIYASTLCALSAHATTINFSGSYGYDMGPVSAGQTGTLTGVAGSSVFGAGSEFSLPSDTQITFNYSLASGSDLNTVGTVGDVASYTELFHTGPPQSTILLGNLPVPYSLLQFYGGSIQNNAPGFFASGSLGQITLANLSPGVGGFFLSILNIPNGDFVIASYSVSPVPLPAALPLFGTALLGLVGIGRMHTRSKRTR